jgi:3',5'-cyclic AMP phosphodiesterase CpdA
MRDDTDVEALLQPLIADLQDVHEGLGVRELDYLVLSGDLTERALPEEFEKARSFVSRLIASFRLTAQRCIITPGNHDLCWDEENLYDFKTKRQVRVEQLKPGFYVEKENWVLVRNEICYPLRLRNFSRFFYHPLMQQEYPLSFQEQGLVSTFADSGLQFLTFNSAWEIDEHFPRRAHIHAGALSRALTQAREQGDQVKASGEHPLGRSLLRIAVWHHPATGAEMMQDESFLERLRQADVRLCLHGHVHEARADIVHPIHPTRKIHVVGAGSMGAPASHRPESTPQLYNLVEIARTHDKARVYTRCRRRTSGAWEGWAVWPGSSPMERRSYYELSLLPSM